MDTVVDLMSSLAIHGTERIKYDVETNVEHMEDRINFGNLQSIYIYTLFQRTGLTILYTDI